jgi:hypothetical protein
MTRVREMQFLVLRRFFATRWKPTDKLRPFSTDPIPKEEEVWHPTKGLHFPEQFYGLYAGSQPIKSYRITKFLRKRAFHVMPRTFDVELYSELMDKKFPFKVTSKALRDIELAGGLDRYLLNRSLDEINSYVGLELRKVLQAKLAGRNESEIEEMLEKNCKRYFSSISKKSEISA